MTWPVTGQLEYMVHLKNTFLMFTLAINQYGLFLQGSLHDAMGKKKRSIFWINMYYILSQNIYHSNVVQSFALLFQKYH